MNRTVLWDAIAGLAAVGLALGVAEFVARAFRETSPVVLVGQYIIDHAPGSASRWAIDLLGENDKPALIVTIIVASLALGGVAGIVGRRWFGAAAGLIAILGLAGVLTAGETPGASASMQILVAAAAVVAGIVALRVLLSFAPENDGPHAATPTPTNASRRQFLGLTGGAAGLAIVSVATGRWVFPPPVNVAEERASVSLPTPQPQTPVPDAAQAAINLDGISPLVTPNADFYRIDTALRVPGVEVDGWTLSVTGLVDTPLELTYDELVDMGVRESMATLACVSNRVGGDLVGNAVWTGVSLAALLDRAGIQAQGSQIIARSRDGFTTAFPTAVALDGRESMVAVGMNGEVLPADHGFPARMIVPGLYGYVSATKWLTEIEVTTIEDFDAYWIERGWAKEGPIKTQSRIDVPDAGASVGHGPVQFGGVAWAGERGVERVEVRIVDEAVAQEELGDDWLREMGPDYGEWNEAGLSDDLTRFSWRQWAVEWDAAPGDYRVEVRATDGDGNTQTLERQDPFPDGATGYHGFRLTVES